MIFSEIYSVYYNAVSHIIQEALLSPVNPEKIREITFRYAFAESIVPVEQAIKKQNWQLILPDGTTPIKNIPDIPLTTLQKRWLKAVSLDKRIKLFDCNFDFLDDIEPLFTEKDYYIFDRCLDGDDYENEEYISRFRMILSAVHNQQTIDVAIQNQKGSYLSFTVMPDRLEYSEKDDKFRLLTTGSRMASVINLGKMISCQLHTNGFKAVKNKKCPEKKRTVTLELTNERNALERVMLHFSHFEKIAEKLDDTHYRLSIKYEQGDETEILIRILSFGSMVRVTSPERFIGMIRNRLKKQKSCGLL